MTDTKKNKAFILSSRKWSDNSLILTLLSYDYGIIKLIAKGALKPRSPFRGKTDIFNYVEILYSEKSTRQLQILTEIDIISHYANIRKTEYGISAFYVMAELVSILIHEHDSADLFFRHLIRLFDWVDNHPGKMNEGLVNFTVAILNYSGYALDYRHCQSCEKREIQDEIFFNLYDGNYLCHQCGGKTDAMLFSLPAAVLRIIRHVNPFKNLIQTNVVVAPELMAAFFRFVSDYLAVHLGKEIQLKSVDLYMQMISGTSASTPVNM